MVKIIQCEGYKNSYIVVDDKTGEVLDDAQGYGYKTAKKAYAAYFWKNRTPEQKKQYEQLTKKIKNWIKHHKRFTNLLDAYAMEIETEINTKLIKELIEIQEITDFPCTPKEFIRFYFK